MGMETTGRLHTIFETKQVSERFSKREFVIEVADNPKYPQVVLFQLTGDRCAQLDELRVGDQVTVEFSLRGREWRSPSGEVKYFNSLDVWKVVPASEAVGAGRGAAGGRGGRGGRGASSDRGPAAPSGDPRDALGIPRDYDPRPGEAEPANDDLPF
jgi:single-stranded DNA-binding protein